MTLGRTGLSWMLVVASFAGFARPAVAQTGAGKPQAPEINKLRLEAGVVPTGKVGGFTGIADATGHRIVAESLSVVQPVSVVVVATDPETPVRADLVKGAWDEPLRSGTTDATGQVVLYTRTEGNMGILVRSASDQPAEYRLAVWVGEEMAGEPASIFQKSRAAARSGGGATSAGGAPGSRGASSNAAPADEGATTDGTLAWVAGAGVLALVLGGAFVMRRRSRAQRQGVLVLCLLALPLTAAAQGKPKLLDKETLQQILENSLKAPAKFGYDKLTDPKNWDPEKWKETFSPLAPEDKDYDEDYDPPGMPELPLECAESDKCASCFDPAYERLKKVRIRFEKLRRVYAWTKAYKERAFALGDSAAGIHGLAGLAWVGKRVELERSYKNFEAAYDAKYEELLQELRASLEQIAECEEEVYGEKDWYNRFGFIYYQFMADRHRRS